MKAIGICHGQPRAFLELFPLLCFQPNNMLFPKKTFTWFGAPVPIVHHRFTGSSWIGTACAERATKGFVQLWSTRGVCKWTTGTKPGATVDERNPKQPPGMYKTLQNMWYLPYQLVSRISSINSISASQGFGESVVYQEDLLGSIKFNGWLDTPLVLKASPRTGYQLRVNLHQEFKK